MWAARMAGVPGLLQGFSRGGTFRVQAGLGIPSRSASTSAIPASSESKNADPEPAGWGRRAGLVAERLRTRKSRNARSLVQSGWSVPSAARCHADERSASSGLGAIGLESRTRSWPQAHSTFSKVPVEGSTWSRSMRQMVV